MRFLRTWFSALIEGARDPDARLLYFAAGGLLLTGTVFYSLVEGWGVLDALYFSVTTLATVGFGDFTPKTELGGRSRSSTSCITDDVGRLIAR
jgi:voltage-gated potassium channel